MWRMSLHSCSRIGEPDFLFQRRIDVGDHLGLRQSPSDNAASSGVYRCSVFMLMLKRLALVAEIHALQGA